MDNNIKKLYNNNTGYILLMSVLIVGAVGLSIITSLILLGVSNSQTSLATERTFQTKALADACIEEALQEISDSTSYVGSDVLSFQQGTCEYLVENLGGQNREVFASSTADGYIRKVYVQIDKINPDINITSWQEVNNF